MIETVLVANRGEIAVRLIRAYRELGVRTIAVYSDADTSALHVRLADEAHRIGPAPVGESYLDGQATIAIARQAGADAIDPGYGLLSENDGFARAVADSGLIFIGPSAEAIATMGDKVAARAIAQHAGVPVVPGSDGVVEKPEQAMRVAELVGYPLLVKTSFGGGGRGMRVVDDPSGLEAALSASAAEAAAAFGRPEVYLERQVRHARHVEVQILADTHGHVLHLGDRDCSVQRRHQKLVEEAPAPFLDDDLRNRIRAAAVRLAAEVGYHSTGTVEFLYEPPTGEFYFLEMNTRLQVEHPVTELVTGLDLVQQRLHVANGRPLTVAQDEVRIHGHAIEVRLTAEDPWQHFLPAPGTITDLHIPSGPWLRADFGVAAGDSVPREYDSLFGKLMAWGPDRETARNRLVTALGELRVSGLPTIAPFLRDVLRRTELIEGTHTTTALEKGWLPDPDSRPEPVVPAAPAMEPNAARVVEVRTAEGPVRVAIHAQRRAGTTVARARRGEGSRAGGGSTAAAGAPIAPMDGVVAKVEVEAGDLVDKHAVLVVVEAMKMQIPITASAPGRVERVLVAVGESVSAGQPLVVIDAETG